MTGTRVRRVERVDSLRSSLLQARETLDIAVARSLATELVLGWYDLGGQVESRSLLTGVVMPLPATADPVLLPSGI